MSKEWRIPFGELKIGEVGRHYLDLALERNWISEGDNVREFERQFAQKFSYPHAVATSSGTDALICCLVALYDFGAERGDEVIVPALTFTATANAVLAAGFIPRFVDIELETLNIDPSKIERAITGKTRAVLPVHLMGRPCRMDEIWGIGQVHGLKVIEDFCESCGTRYKGRAVGSWGDMGANSFYTAHTIVCGEGGMVVTEDSRIAEIVRSVKSHGRPPGSLYFDFQRFGLNCKMNDLEAAIGLDGLANFDDTFQKRRHNLCELLILTKDLSRYCYFIAQRQQEVISPHAFPLVLKDKRYDRDKLYNYLESKGIQCKTLFGSLPTQHKAFAFLGYKYGDFPVAEYVGENGLHFGIHQYLDVADLEYISETLRNYFSVSIPATQSHSSP